MESSKPSKLILNLLVFITVIGLILAGWLTGHIVRHITPAYQHPPIEEIGPHIKTGYLPESDGQLTIIGTGDVTLDGSDIRVYSGQTVPHPQAVCASLTYFTSLPAKCHTFDGQLARVGGNEWNGILIP